MNNNYVLCFIKEPSTCPDTQDCLIYKCNECGEEFCLEHDHHDCINTDDHDGGHNLSKLMISMLWEGDKTEEIGENVYKQCGWGNGKWLTRWCYTCECPHEYRIDTDISKLPSFGCSEKGAEDGYYEFKGKINPSTGKLEITKLTFYRGASGSEPSCKKNVHEDWFTNEC